MKYIVMFVLIIMIVGCTPNIETDLDQENEESYRG